MSALGAAARRTRSARGCATARDVGYRRRRCSASLAVLPRDPADRRRGRSSGRSSSASSRSRAGSGRSPAASAALGLGRGRRRARSGSALGILATQSSTGNLEHRLHAPTLIASMFVFSTPLVFGAIGGMFSERSGVVNIGLEGMMLMGAFLGVYGADKGGSWVVGLLVAMARRRARWRSSTRTSRSTCAPTRSSAARR